MTEPPKKIQLRCPKCGSTDVGCDAAARWDYASQSYIVGLIYDDSGWCDACGVENIDLIEDDSGVINDN